MILAGLAIVTSLAGVVFVVLGAIAVRAFVRRGRTLPQARPPVTVMKPLCGDEPLLEAALATICEQDYPELQIVFGVQDADDPALLAVESLQRRFPDHDISVVIDHRVHGSNRKISNLINMLHTARHDVLILSDSDLHVPRNYIDQIVAALEAPGVGLVTTLCSGLPTRAGLIGRLGATAITHNFLPGVLISRWLGREDCLGTTMGLRRETLVRIGGLNKLVGCVADDQVLGRETRRVGLTIALAAVVAKTGVSERSPARLFEHELRWARTIRALEPGLFAASALQYPLFWAASSVLLSGAAAWSVASFAAIWAVRALAACWIDRALRLRGSSAAVPILLLPLRDVLSVGQVVASYFGGRVVWRGRVMEVVGPRRLPAVWLPDAANLALASQERAASAGSRRATER